MIDNITKVILTAFIITAVGIALRPNAPTAKVISSITNGVVSMQKAATGA